MTDQIVATGCPFTVPPGKPQPCVLAKWPMPTARVLVQRQPGHGAAEPGPGRCCCRDSQAICAPTGTAVNMVLTHTSRCEGERDEHRFSRSTSTTAAAPPPTDDDDHIRDMIEQFLFTNPGERVNRPDFGSGLLQLVFAPNSPELAAALQFTIQAGLQRWLGDLIEVQALEVTSEEATLARRLVQYVVRRTGEQRAKPLSSGSVQ